MAIVRTTAENTYRTVLLLPIPRLMDVAVPRRNNRVRECLVDY
jgi:hypothetical protein